MLQLVCYNESDGGVIFKNAFVNAQKNYFSFYNSFQL